MWILKNMSWFLSEAKTARKLIDVIYRRVECKSQLSEGESLHEETSQSMKRDEYQNIVLKMLLKHKIQGCRSRYPLRIYWADQGLSSHSKLWFPLQYFELSSFTFRFFTYKTQIGTSSERSYVFLISVSGGNYNFAVFLTNETFPLVSKELFKIKEVR